MLRVDSVSEAPLSFRHFDCHEDRRARTWVVITRAGEAALAAEIKTPKSLLDL